jgi:hypothetical protein
MDLARWRMLDRAAGEYDEIGTQTLAQMITAEAEAIAAEARAGKRHGERRYLAELAMQHRLACRFGAERGWTLSRTTFGLVTLQRGKRHSGSRYAEEGDGFFRGDIACFFDHPYWYRREGKAAAIIAHLYRGEWDDDDRKPCEALAGPLGLVFEVPDFPSWWNPGRGGTTLVAYIGPAGR